MTFAITTIGEHARMYLQCSRELLRDVVDEYPLARDHIGYRCASHESYEQAKAHLMQTTRFLEEVSVEDRRISTFRFIDAILGFRKIEVAELKKENGGKEGISHLAYIVNNLEEMHAQLSKGPVRVKPIREVNHARYFKIGNNETELEFRERSISE